MSERLQRITVTLDHATPPTSRHPDNQQEPIGRTGLRPTAVYCAQARLTLERELRRASYQNESKLRVPSRLLDCMVNFLEAQPEERG